MITSGINAIGGSARKKLINGSRNFLMLAYQPSANPIGTAHTVPNITPINTRCADIYMSSHNACLVSMLQNATDTCHGVGTSPGLTNPERRIRYHAIMSTAQGAITIASFLTNRTIKLYRV